MRRILLLACTAALALVLAVTLNIRVAEGGTCQTPQCVKRVQAAKFKRLGYDGCRTWACASRVKEKRIERAGFKGCRTWKCVRRVKDKRWRVYLRAITPPGPGWLAALRACEGGRYGYGANTGNGFFGAYQFVRGTWNSYTLPLFVGVRPDLAPPQVQDITAARTYRRGGPGHWPNCP